MSSRSLTPSWIDTFEALQSASTVEELWGVLVTWHGIRSSTAWDEPYTLFMRFHDDDSKNADMTAALLCTDHRWGKAAHHLINRLSTSGALDDGQLDVLAEWFSDEGFEVSLASAGGGGRRRQRSTKVRRPIWPPLRRWAARRKVERQPESWRPIVDASRALPSRDAAATVAGIMDAVDRVPLNQRAALAELGLDHGSGTVRLAALPILASTAGVCAALVVARRDVSAKVRAWKPSLSADADSRGISSATGAEKRSKDAPVGQASLFDE